MQFSIGMLSSLNRESNNTQGCGILQQKPMLGADPNFGVRRDEDKKPSGLRTPRCQLTIPSSHGTQSSKPPPAIQSFGIENATRHASFPVSSHWTGLWTRGKCNISHRWCSGQTTTRKSPFDPQRKDGCYFKSCSGLNICFDWAWHPDGCHNEKFQA